MERYKHTKNNYKKEIETMSKEDLLNEVNKLNKDLIKARYIINQKQNPFKGGQFPISLIKWKRAICKMRI